MFYSEKTGGFYDKKIHADKMPADAAEISDENYAALFDAQSKGAQIKADAEGKPFAAFPNPPTLAELKTAKKAEITQAFNLDMSAVVGDTPAHEISSWSKQEAEARSFANAATTLNPMPLIDNLASARGIQKTLLAGKIIQKADLYSSYSGQLIGKRQGLEDAIDAATTKAAVAAISWA